MSGESATSNDAQASSSQTTSPATNGWTQRKTEEIEIPVPWGIVAGKWWGPRNKQPVLAIHGWQDNAGTFDRLCPLLPDEIPILAIDLPGHGKSSHYPVGMHYYIFWDGIALIRRIVKHFAWSNVILMGHSLGGALSFMYAAAYPDQVESFISIDIAGPPARDHREQAANLGESIDRFLHYEKLPESKTPCYKYEDAVDVVHAAYEGSVDMQSVEILMRRGMSSALARFNKPGYYFARDLRLKVALMGMLGLEQVIAHAEKIKCRVLNIRADPGRTWENPEYYPSVIEAMKKSAREVIYLQIPGTHHIHLVNPERISIHVTRFLIEQ
ncbi:probable serine hydrolase [Uranotaenia lowii]|uniref:probable serine hydrolase n=1 Tax=Uranotaenia lowii TaxID=190385 RepID=UPI00247AC905|nr:probable serine hydrolase [Uranotaenia lowii]XP_055598622.1 probable serine hydrolase [Uranotaenia lowii]